MEYKSRRDHLVLTIVRVACRANEVDVTAHSVTPRDARVWGSSSTSVLSWAAISPVPSVSLAAPAPPRHHQQTEQHF